MIFVTEGQIIRFNFITLEKSVLYDFENNFTEQPEFFTFNDNQQACIIASTIDTLLIDFSSNKETDLDKIFLTKEVKKVLSYNGYFYVLANIIDGNLGNYLLRIPDNYDEMD